MSDALFSSQCEWVTEDKIQQIFNESQFYEQARAGKLKQKVQGYDNHLSRKQRRKAGEPYCTRSQMVLYSTLEGQPIALVHQYKRRDGSLGASGKPDPKRLFISGKILAIRQGTNSKNP